MKLKQLFEMSLDMNEKPLDWTDIKKTITRDKISDLNINPPTIKAADYFIKDIHPTADIKDEAPEYAIVVLPTGKKYFANKGGSKKYVRMWAILSQ